MCLCCLVALVSAPVVCAHGRCCCKSVHHTCLPQQSAELCMLLSLQTQDSAESMSLLLKELYDATKDKSVIDAETVLPLLLISDKYNITTIISRCTKWLNDLDSKRLRDTLLTVSPVRGKGKCCICKRYLGICMLS